MLSSCESHEHHMVSCNVNVPMSPTESKYASLQGELEADAQDLEGDSWSLVVDQDYLKPMSKQSIKRQDVIYGRHRPL